MAFTLDFFTGRKNNVDGQERIGELNRLWYEPETNTIRVSDGQTPGGIIVSGGGSSGGGGTGPRGYTGSRGAGYTGSQGSIGDFGYTGSRGEIGFIGSQGNQGLIGFTGSQGQLGYIGSRGDTGYVGSQGDQGLIGFTGSQGEGFTGSNGDTGFVGSAGELGYTGSEGISYTGSAGVSGFTGSSGGDVSIGSAPPVTGTLWFNSIDARMYIKYNDQWVDANPTVWPTTLPEQGYDGSIGFTGSTGATGYTGSQSYTGSTGYNGSLGYTGSFGYTGSSGNVAVGATPPLTGTLWFNSTDARMYFKYNDQWVDANPTVWPTTLPEQGYDGSIGYTGSSGLVGYTGSQSYTGSVGYTGSFGYSGSFGFTGSSGNISIGSTPPVTGALWFNNIDARLYIKYNDQWVDANPTVWPTTIADQGYNGSIGYSGSAGFTGSQSYTGSAGYTGSFGYTGSLGYTGSSGNVAVGNAPPVTGTLWFNDVEARMYIKYNGQWVDANPSIAQYVPTDISELADINGLLSSGSGNGYTGSSASNGYTGSAGANGVAGSQGPIGYTGSSGSGYIGSTGTTGFVGSAGTNGTNGTNGFTGSAGTNGIDGFTGSTGVDGFIGSAGLGFTFYGEWTGTTHGYYLINDVVTYQGNTYVCKYPTYGNTPPSEDLGGFELIAAKGSNGSDGYSGSQGDLGYTGSQSYTGSRGYIGSVGYTGSQGPYGYTGSIPGTYVSGITAGTGTVVSAASGAVTVWMNTGTLVTNAVNLVNGANRMTVVSAPGALTGASGDTVGNVAFDSSYIYYCTTAYVPNSWTGTFLNSEGASNSNQLTISNNWNPTLAYTPANAWTVTFNPGGGNITRTISSVSSWSNSYPNGYWVLTLTSNWTGTVYGGNSFTITSDSTLPNIWVRTPWNAVTAGTGYAGSIGSQGFTGSIGIGYAGLTSASGWNPGTGSYSFTTNLPSTQVAFIVGNRVRVTNNAGTAYVEGIITSFSGTTLALTADSYTGPSAQTTAKITLAGGLGYSGSVGYTGSFGYIGSQGPIGYTGSINTATLIVSNRIGIATASPSYPLDVVGDIHLSGTFRMDGLQSAGIGLIRANNIGSDVDLSMSAGSATGVLRLQYANGSYQDALTVSPTTGTVTIKTSLIVNGIVTATSSIISNAVTAFIAGDAAISGVALQVPREGAIRNLYNGAANNMYFDVSTGGASNGQFQFRSSSAFTNVLTMSPTAFNVNPEAVVTAKTASFGRLAWNSAIDTELTIDDYRFRISNSGGIFPQIISNTGGTKNSAWTAVGAISGDAVKQAGSTGNLVPNNSWVSLYTLHGMDAPGDTVTVTLQDKNAGRIYRITFMRSDDGSTTGYNIIAERLL